MKTIILSKDGSLKIKRGDTSLFSSDFKDLPRSFTPGEWCIFFNEKSKEKYLGYINLGVKTNTPIGHVLTETDKDFFDKSEIVFLIKEKIKHAIDFRSYFNDLDQGARLIYGESDKLAGIVVDEYKNYVLIQINTAGFDLFRNEIKEYISSLKSQKNVILFDNSSYRELECLPQYEKEQIVEDIQVEENGISYTVEKNSIQKIGYYYDHRINRQKASRLVSKIKFKKDKGLDLFCYVGSWGLNLLQAGCDHVDFVDQGNLKEVVEKNIVNNHFNGRGNFYREDCFDFLDKCINHKKTFNIICSDPPAFAKTGANKAKALEGYQKLHSKIMKVAESPSLLLIGSCTHNVSLEELDQTVQEASRKNNRTVSLVDLGLQGPDHRMNSISSKSNYIKFLAYIVE